MDNILEDVKTSLGILPEDQVFDEELKMFTNTALVVLSQIGVGPKGGFRVETGEETWGDFIPTDMYQNVKTAVYLRVRMLFDPPSNSFLMDAMERQLKEVEWRLYTQNELDEKEVSE